MTLPERARQQFAPSHFPSHGLVEYARLAEDIAAFADAEVRRALEAAAAMVRTNYDVACECDRVGDGPHLRRYYRDDAGVTRAYWAVLLNDPPLEVRGG